VNQNSSELEFFLLFFTEALVQLIADECNRFYMDIIQNASATISSRLSRWTDTNLEEMFCFFAICMLMTRVKKLKISEYWSTDVLLQTPVFGKIMSRDRFLLLLRMLHFSDNNSDACGDRLYKIRHVVDSLRTSFKSSFSPYQDVVIDESLLLFKGRLSFKQYIPSKRSRFGIKTFVMCDCKTGYILDFIVYTGAVSDIDVSGLGKGADIVSTLLYPYLHKGHTLYVDNWYTSPDLFMWLHDRATNACGTVRKSRKNMPKMEQKLKKNEICFRSSKNLLAIKWCDKKEVWMLTTCHNSDIVPTVKKRLEKCRQHTQAQVYC
jgi:hypothetical protein